MSKLFNIQNGGGNDDEMYGGKRGDIDTIRLIKNEKNITDEKIQNIIEVNGSDSEKKNKEKITEDLNNGIEIPETELSFKTGLKIVEELKKLDNQVNLSINTTGQPQNSTITTVPIASETQGSIPATGETTDASTPGKPQPPPARECIHIGIIDETGTFVGVKSITKTDTEIDLFNKLSVIATDLKEKIKNQINETQSVATIYDQFVKTSDGSCVPTFITGYDTKFFNSDELKNMFNKAPDKENLPFTLKTTTPGDPASSISENSKTNNENKTDTTA